jgi:photosystem II stability/assembly factor-like uncharacterized protein
MWLVGHEFAIGSEEATSPAQVLKSNDRGEHWTLVSLPFSPPGGFSSLWVNGEGDVYLAGSDIFHSGDGGQTWRAQTNLGSDPFVLQAEGISSKGVSAIIGLPGGELYAVVNSLFVTYCMNDYSATILHTLDGGGTWTRQSLSARLFSVWASGSAAYVAGALIDCPEERYLLLETHDHGQSWITTERGGPWQAFSDLARQYGQAEFQSVWGTGPCNVYVGGTRSLILHGWR